MDDLFDSLIYIIITLVAFVISALGKKKKKTQRVSPVNQSEQTEKEEKPFFSNFENLLKEELGLIEEDEPEPTQVQQKVESVPEPEHVEEKEKPLDFVPPEMLDDKPDTPYSIEYEDTNEIFSKSIKDEDLTEEDDESILDNFNLEEAVIYSEILNRKEY